MKEINWAEQDWRVLTTPDINSGATTFTISCQVKIVPEEKLDDGIRVFSRLKVCLEQGELLKELIERLNNAILTGATTLDINSLCDKLESGKFE